MKLTKAIDTFTVIVCTTLCLVQLTKCKDISRNSENEKVDRTRREISDFDEIKPEDEKRQREFIGKRSAGEQSSLDISEILPESDEFPYNNVDKRLREFVGKRALADFEEEKRMRDFLGKRDYTDDDMEKRQREFVGKRSQYYDDEEGDDFDTYDKRMREFIGKRSYDDYSYLAKRLREFVGKRLTPEGLGYYRRLRQPKYQRELVGKRSPPMYDNFNEDKRMREFIGKRMREFIGKRMRDFLG